VGALKVLGFSRQKRRYLVEPSELVAGEKMDLGSLETMDTEQMLNRVREIRFHLLLDTLSAEGYLRRHRRTAP